MVRTLPILRTLPRAGAALRTVVAAAATAAAALAAVHTAAVQLARVQRQLPQTVAARPRVRRLRKQIRRMRSRESMEAIRARLLHSAADSDTVPTCAAAA
jgi:hypothetical protein